MNGYNKVLFIMLTKYGKHCLRYFSGKAQAHEVGIFPNLFVLFGHWVDRIVQENWAQVWIKGQGISKIMIKTSGLADCLLDTALPQQPAATGIPLASSCHRSTTVWSSERLGERCFTNKIGLMVRKVKSGC